MTLTTTSQPQRPHVKRWTKREYNRAVDLGTFAGQRRLFLFRGELIEMPPMGHEHAVALTRVTRVLFDVFGRAAEIRIQMPFETPGESMPEPDAAVCTPAAAARAPHPAEALLLIEVADSSLDLDHDKADEYAAARVADYWVLNVVRRELEVYREPAPDPAKSLGYFYARHEILNDAASIAPLANPVARIKVADLLP